MTLIAVSEWTERSLHVIASGTTTTVQISAQIGTVWASPQVDEI